eukprot:CAMPEP_0119038396 /NCGR_PEP_ID=MMETSP1177-20130426/7315_1 /TAXON_ID=2985 /ORGANISM="Ochromonas sp, Strain CCMP1899" /LENGTH=1028 /DNA_ID=CAMNT_0007000949 /DNA_START=157 /DNA_END=3243 /DNA_ORIENTATION=+
MMISKRNYVAQIERLSLSSIMGDRGDRRRSRQSSDVHSPFTSSLSVTSTDSNKARNSSVRTPTVIASLRRSSLRSPVVVTSGRTTKSPIRKESPFPPSQSPVPAYPQNDVIKQQQEKRFTDGKGTIYPKLGDRVLVLFDEKDWYSGSVHDFNIETKIVAVVYDDAGEFEMIDFPSEDLVVITETGVSQRNGGHPLNPTLSENDLNMEDFDDDYIGLIGLQYAEFFFLREVLVEYWCSIFNVKVVRGKDMCDCVWSDGSKTVVPVQTVVDHINLNRANERRGKNGATAFSESGRSTRTKIPLRDVSNDNRSNNLKKLEKTEKLIKSEKSSKLNTSVSTSKIRKNSKTDGKKSSAEYSKKSDDLECSDIDEYCVEPVRGKRSKQSFKFEMNKKNKNSKIVGINETIEASQIIPELTTQNKEVYSPIGGLALLIGDYSKTGFDSQAGTGGQTHSKKSGARRGREEELNKTTTSQAIFENDIILSLPALTLSRNTVSKSSPLIRSRLPSSQPSLVKSPINPTSALTLTVTRINPEIMSALLNSTKSSVPSYVLKATLEFALRNQHDKYPMPSSNMVKNLLDSLSKNATNVISKEMKYSGTLEDSEKNEKNCKKVKNTDFYNDIDDGGEGDEYIEEIDIEINNSGVLLGRLSCQMINCPQSLRALSNPWIPSMVMINNALDGVIGSIQKLSCDEISLKTLVVILKISDIILAFIERVISHDSASSGAQHEGHHMSLLQRSLDLSSITVGMAFAEMYAKTIDLLRSLLGFSEEQAPMLEKIKMTVYSRKILKSAMGILNTIADLMMSSGGSHEYSSHEVWYHLLFQSVEVVITTGDVSTSIVNTVDVPKNAIKGCKKKVVSSQEEIVVNMPSDRRIHCKEVLDLAWMIEKSGGSCLRVQMLYCGLKRFHESQKEERGGLTGARGKGGGNKDDIRKKEVQSKVLHSEVEISAKALGADLARIAFKDIQELCQDGFTDVDSSAMTDLECKGSPLSRGIKHHTDVSFINLAAGVTFVRNATKGINSSTLTLPSALLA